MYVIRNRYLSLIPNHSITVHFLNIYLTYGKLNVFNYSEAKILKINLKNKTSVVLFICVFFFSIRPPQTFQKIITLEIILRMFDFSCEIFI